MKFTLRILFVVLLAAQRSGAEQFDKVAVPDIESAASFKEAKSFDEVVVMRFSETHEPQMVEITNPLHKILIARMVEDEQMLPRGRKFNTNVVVQFLTSAGVVVAKEICKRFVL